MMFNPFKSPRKNKVGITLSGGGMRGVAHIGILKALEEFHLVPEIISGTSMGAIVGAFYSYGYNPDQMLEIVLKGEYFNRKNLKLSQTGVFNSQLLMKTFQDYIPKDSFENLKIPIYIATTELTHGRIEYINSGPLHRVLLASASVPFVFTPVRIGEKLYIDGGVMNNFPIEPIKKKCNFLIGAHVNSIYFDPLKKINAANLLKRIINLALSTPTYEKSRECQLFIDPSEMTKHNLFSEKSLINIYESGYLYTKKLLKENNCS